VKRTHNIEASLFKNGGGKTGNPHAKEESGPFFYNMYTSNSK
jgi:hypothetical protein